MIIGFGHRRYVGKDTAAAFAVSHIRATRRGVLTIKTGFASKLKLVTHDLYSWAGLQDEEYYEQNPAMKDVILPLIGKTPREIWIEFGTTVGRSIYSDTWLQYIFNRKCDYAFIKDVRFPNEADGILAVGGIVIRVDNPRIEQFNDVADEGLKNYDKWTDVLINDVDLVTLNTRTIALMDKYVK